MVSHLKWNELCIGNTGLFVIKSGITHENTTMESQNSLLWIVKMNFGNFATLQVEYHRIVTCWAKTSFLAY